MALDWRALLLYIREGHVVPVVGPEITTISVEGRTEPLDCYLARQLRERLAIDTAQLPSSYTLNDVASTFRRELRGDRRRLWIEMMSLLDEAPAEPLEPLRQLAGIREFRLFVTTTFDGLLARALEQARRDEPTGTQICGYSVRSQIADLPANWALAKPTLVYHLFGRASASGDYALSDEDRLEFIHSLQSEARRPRQLFDQLRDSHLLLLGCNFPDWFARFFLRMLRREPLGTERGQSEAVADETTHANSSLVMFLQDCRVQVYSGGAKAFVAELASRLGTSSPPGVTAAPAPDRQRPVFLSYAREDFERVKRLCEAFTQAGIDVWFDEQALEPGEEYKEIIRQAIEKCVFFLPCVSRYALRGPIRRFVRFEWTRAIEEADFRPSDPPFLQPIILDDTAPDSELLPPAFRKRHVVRWPSGDPPPADLIQLTKSRLAAIAQDRRDS